jgi:hypothetical protein
MEILGKTRVMVKDGKVIEAGQPQITWCPLWDKASGIKEITKETAIRVWIWACSQVSGYLRL